MRISRGILQNSGKFVESSFPLQWFPDSIRSQIPDFSGIPNSTSKHFLDSGLRNSLLEEYLAFILTSINFLDSGLRNSLLEEYLAFILTSINF